MVAALPQLHHDVHEGRLVRGPHTWEPEGERRGEGGEGMEGEERHEGEREMRGGRGEG